MIVCDSTVLIYLSKIGRLGLLKRLFGKVLIPEEVKKEVVDEGRKRNHIDAADVEKAILRGWIGVKVTSIDPILENIGIDKGEAEAISLAYYQKKGILLDQTHAREAAKLLKLKPRGTIYVLFLALKKRQISYRQYELCLLDLVDTGFRLSEEVYIEALRMGKELSRKR